MAKTLIFKLTFSPTAMQRSTHTTLPIPVIKLADICWALLPLLFLAPTGAMAFQEDGFLSFKGEVVDGTTGKALVFATLNVEGTNISTITNTEGNFLLKVPMERADSNLLVSFLGYRTMSLPLSGLQPEN